MGNMTEAELKIVLTIAKKTHSNISYNEFMRITGQSKSTIIKVIQSSIEKNWIITKDKKGEICDTPEKGEKSIKYQLGDLIQENKDVPSLETKTKKTLIFNKKVKKVPLCKKVGLTLNQWREMIDLFKVMNPMFLKIYKIIPERNALAEMYQTFGFEKTISYIKLASKHYGAPYSPQITSPTELLRNLGKLIAFDKKEKSNKNNSLSKSEKPEGGKYDNIKKTVVNI